MKPGKELDKLIAEKVMGGIRHYTNSIVAFDVSAKSITIGGSSEYPRYSTDIAAAWEVVEKLTKQYWIVQLYHYQANEYGYNGWRCQIESIDQQWEGNEDTAPHAICLAALKTLGIE